MRLNAAIVVSLFALLLATSAGAQFGGTWQGTFQERWLCGTGNFTATGTLSLAFNQSGNDVTGSFTFVRSFESCVVLPSPKTYTGSVSGRVSGKTLTHYFHTDPESEFIATLSADDATLSWRLANPDPPDYFLNATLTRVTPAAAPPEVVASAFPQGMVRVAGGPLPTDSFTVTNIGGTSTRITLQELPSNPFFALRPMAFDLAPGSSEIVFITALERPEQYLEAAPRVSGNGAGFSVPIRLLTAAAPATPVTITASEARTEFAVEKVIISPAPPQYGQVVFTNSGASPIFGFVMPDVTWIDVVRSDLNIQPGQSAEVTFSITSRPDADDPVGAVIGSLTFNYVNSGTEGAAHPEDLAAFATVPIVSKVSVVIIAVGALDATPASVPPIPPGQFAFFVPGASSSLTAGDLVLSNFDTSAIADFAMYFTPPGGGSGRSVSIPQFKPDSGISFPGVVKNIFKDSPAKTGTLHLRSSALSKVSVAHAQVDTTRGLSYALPVLRLEDGLDAGQALFLPGVQSSTAMSTTLFLQEMAQRTASVTVDALDAQGVVKASTPVTFVGLVELANVAPAGTATVRVTNNSSTGARINGYALVSDKTTTDAFTIAQVGPATDPMFCPAFDPAMGELLLHLTNASNSPISITATTVSSGQRRRSTRHASNDSNATPPPPVTIPPFGYAQMNVTGSGFVRLTGSTALRVAGQLAVPSNGGSVGSGIAVLPASRARKTMRFAGIEDAAPSTVAFERKLTYRTNLMLVETTGNEVTVKLTLHYVFSSGKVSSGTSSTVTLLVPAGSFRLINDLARSIIGASREHYGDMHNAILDVEVTSGSGSVLAFLQVIDNGSGDVTIRHE